MSKLVRSSANAGVKAVVKLRGRRARKQTGLFLVEGFREIRRALELPTVVEELWFSPKLFLGTNEPDVVERASKDGAETIEVPPAVFEKMAYRDRPEGLLAVCRQFDTSLARIKLGPQPLVLVVESIEKPGNLGTMIRTATAAAADAVIVCDPTTDVFNPNVVRASIGTLFSVPIAVCSTDDAVHWLRSRGVEIFAATPSARIDLWDAKLRNPAAVVVGAEQYGLSDEWLEAADRRVRIPMPGETIDSLNAATSAAILLFEAVRQRRSP